MDLPQIVVIGGGFGGLAAVRALRRARAKVTLIDRRNHHLFQPLLYQVATAALNASEIATPLRTLVRRQKNTVVMMAEAKWIDVAKKCVCLDTGRVPYDYLVVATGATHSYFGNEQWGTYAPGLKTIEDALEIRRRVLSAFERAELETTEASRREWLTFVIVGAGPTGAELAGALADIARHSLAKEYRVIDPRKARVVLVEGLPHVLPTYPTDLSESARRQLERLGVEVRTKTRVIGVDDRGVQLEGERIDARTVLWAAGVSASPLARTLGPVDRAGRVLVEQDLSVPGHPEIFVIGDAASFTQDGKPVPGVAPAAIQEGRHVGKLILRELEGKPRRPFRYRDKGSFATLGRAAAVGTVGKNGTHVTGFLAWIAWLVIHLFFLIGFRNRFLVLFGWAYSYLTNRRGARLITGEKPPLPDVPVGARWEAEVIENVRQEIGAGAEKPAPEKVVRSRVPS